MTLKIATITDMFTRLWAVPTLADFAAPEAPDFLTDEDDIEWIEVGSCVVIHGEHEDYEGVVVATCPETQRATVRYWHTFWKEELTHAVSIAYLELVETVA